MTRGRAPGHIARLLPAMALLLLAACSPAIDSSPIEPHVVAASSTPPAAPPPPAPTSFLVGRYGRLRSVLALDEHTIGVTTSNRDGRIAARAGDDRILKIRVR
ncbi:hypothetical protein BH11ACT8_BH11ACT8_15820 [soil metagenome]